ncbi:MAG: flagellin [Candidatus Binatia bacterium]
MALYVNTNSSSINAQRHLEETGTKLNSALERLSSGVRINNAYDDAAGLAIADRLSRDVRVLGQAIRNANDGISALAIGEKALGSVTDILTRLSELASQSATGTVTNTQRSAIQAEFTALLSEIGRLSNTTSFNGVQLLSAGTTVTLQVGLDGSTNSQIQFTTVDGSVSGILSLAQTSIAASTQESAQSALGFLTSAIANVAQTRGSLGAFESRLLSSITAARVAKENFSAAEGRIRDADVAAETAELTRGTILQQAGTAVLAQANQQPSLALTLLR